MNILLAILIGFIIGMFSQRIFLARCKGFTKLGKSWDLSKNKFYRFLHRIWCWECPRRWYCDRYKEMKNDKEKRSEQKEEEFADI